MRASSKGAEKKSTPEGRKFSEKDERGGGVRERAGHYPTLH